MSHEIAQTGYMVRASALPGWNDCARREGARLFPELIEAAGYTLCRRPNTVGASVGSSVHAGARYTMESKLATGDIGNETEADQRALETMKSEIEAECQWDQVTRDPNTAEQQIVRMLRAFRDDAAPRLNPATVEERLEADLGDGFTVTGKKDMLCRTPDGIDDLKTGTQQRPNGAQYGGYSLIDRAHGRTIDALNEIFIPRATLKKPQPEPTFIPYDVQACEVQAAATLDDMKRSIADFHARAAGSAPGEPAAAFRANPMSMLCGEKYCPAFGTDFCRVHKRKPEEG